MVDKHDFWCPSLWLVTNVVSIGPPFLVSIAGTHKISWLPRCPKWLPEKFDNAQLFFTNKIKNKLNNYFINFK